MSGPGRSRLARELVTIPNLMSLSRIAIIYVSAALLLAGRPLSAVLVGLVAGITDYLDGYLARRLGQVTELGAVLDRLSDLVFESTWIVAAVSLGDFPHVVIFAYLLREFVVLSARLYCSAHGVALGSTLAGKLKSNFFGYTALAMYLAHSEVLGPLRGVLQVLGVVGIIGALGLSYWSAWIYLKVFAKAYNERS